MSIEPVVLIKEIRHLIMFPYGQPADSDTPVNGSVSDHQRLGPAGLALHYANIVMQIDALVSI